MTQKENNLSSWFSSLSQKEKKTLVCALFMLSSYETRLDSKSRKLFNELRSKMDEEYHKSKTV